MNIDRYKVADLLMTGRLYRALGYVTAFGKDDLATRINELIYSSDQAYPELLEDIIVYDLGIKTEGL